MMEECERTEQWRRMRGECEFPAARREGSRRPTLGGRWSSQCQKCHSRAVKPVEKFAPCWWVATLACTHSSTKRRLPSLLPRY